MNGFEKCGKVMTFRCDPLVDVPLAEFQPAMRRGRPSHSFSALVVFMRFADRLTPSVLDHDKLQFALYFKTVASLVLGEWRAM